MGAALVLLLAWQGLSQGPLNGIAKSTVAAETDPLGGLAFMQRYLGAVPTGDSCSANVCGCHTGDSEAPAPWTIVQGRAQLVISQRDGSQPGKCILRTRADRVKHLASAQVAVIPSGTPGVDCSYTPSAEVPPATGDKGYVVNSHSADTCCKACVAMEGCVGATHVPRNSTNLASNRFEDYGPNEGFGLHLIAVSAHKTTGGMTVREVEALVAAKLENMSVFDGWMEFNVGLYTSDLDSYIELWDSEVVPYLAAKWQAPLDGTMHSVFLHVPKSQMIVEVIGKSRALDLRTGVVHLEQRLSNTRLSALRANPPAGTILQAAKVSRAATDLLALDEFYVNGMKAAKVHSIAGDDVSTDCYLWPGAATDVCFVKRPDNATKGDFKVADFERMLKTVADTMLTTPTCWMDRWDDNHYIVSLNMSFDATHFNYIGQYLAKNPSVKYLCSNVSASAHGVLHHVFDPTGWGFQLEPMANGTFPGCASIPYHKYPGKFPVCDGGVCS